MSRLQDQERPAPHVHTPDRETGPQRSTGCVRPDRCNGAAHGNVAYVDVCDCGAERHVNVNGMHVEYGEWG